MFRFALRRLALTLVRALNAILFFHFVAALIVTLTLDCFMVNGLFGLIGMLAIPDVYFKVALGRNYVPTSFLSVFSLECLRNSLNLIYCFK